MPGMRVNRLSHIANIDRAPIHDATQPTSTSSSSVVTSPIPGMRW